MNTALFNVRSLLAITIVGTLATSACSNDAEDCHERLRCGLGGASTANGGIGGAGGAQGGGGVGAGNNPGGGGVGGMSECATDVDCTDATKAQCDTANNGGTCVPCSTSPHCAGVAGLPVCDGGTCIECMLGEEGACGGAETCDLLAKECVGVAPLTVKTCEPCTNDTQCQVGHKCIPLDYPTIGTLHGHYCLEPPAPPCVRPYVAIANKTSISGELPATYCGVSETLATCEAVLALQAARFCTVDGMCSETVGGMDTPVPGAICRDLFGGANPGRCTYQCAGVDEQCPGGGAGEFCGDEVGTNPPDFCGGDTN